MVRSTRSSLDLRHQRAPGIDRRTIQRRIAIKTLEAAAAKN
jgi:hypothetical protein